MTREGRLARAKAAMRLYAVTDRAWTDDAAGRTLEAQVAAALAGGATCVQLREKHLDDADFLEEAFRIRDLCRAAGVPFFVNDNVGIALAVGADGVHVGQDDMPVAEVRRLVGPDMLIGVSAHTVDEALAAVAGGADCLGVGAMFPTATKDDAEAVTLEELAAICGAVDVGVVAIGGIKAETIPQFAGTGIAGVAVVSAIFAAPDTEAATRSLRREIDAIVPLPCRFTAAVFDVDGTLFDSMPLWFTCGDRFLESVDRVPKPGL
ncbi:MAG: thiamine phosphate synthase [Eggerthellaceae bacterium]|nr:thiamine phosphate synthase [Eggerthellaceae bacterium]